MGSNAEPKAKIATRTLRSLLAAMAFMAAPFLVQAADAETPASDRTIQFLTNAHTGVAMSDSEWLTAEARSTAKISGHGGLSRLIEQTTAHARGFKGLKSVAVLDVVELKNMRRIRAEVKFFDEKRRKASPSAAEREDMIWTFIAKKEEGKWKLQF